MSSILTPDGVQSLITAAEAAQHAEVSTVTIRSWANRGYVGVDGQRHRLRVEGKDEAGRNLYRLIEVAKAEHATRSRRRG